MKWIKAEEQYYARAYDKNFQQVLKQAIMSADWSKLPTKTEGGDSLPKINSARLANEIIALLEDAANY